MSHFMEDHNGNEVSVHNLCYLIYQGFGQQAVLAFADYLTNNNLLAGISWQTCEPCETESAIYDNACLVCSSINTDN